jgi:hypothetical protein
MGSIPPPEKPAVDRKACVILEHSVATPTRCLTRLVCDMTLLPDRDRASDNQARYSRVAIASDEILLRRLKIPYFLFEDAMCRRGPVPHRAVPLPLVLFCIRAHKPITKENWLVLKSERYP